MNARTSARPDPSGPIAASAAASSYRIVVAVLLFLALFVSCLDRTNIAVLNADPAFQDAMGMAGQAAHMGLLMSVFLLAYGIGNIVLAPLGNVLGPRKAMLIAIVIWCLSTFAGGLAAGFGQMLAIRIVLGFGEGLHWPMQSLFVTRWFPARERARANAAWLVGLTAGPVIGIPLTAWIVGISGWRASFYVLAGISLIPLILIGLLTADTPRQSRYVNAAERDDIETNAQAATASGAATDRTANPIAMWGFLKSGDFWLVTIAFLASSSLFWSGIAWLPMYLRVARHFNWNAMGLLGALPYLCNTVTVLVFGAVADRCAKKAVFAAIALTGAALSIFAAALVPDRAGAVLLLSLAFGFLGVGLSSYWTIMQNNVEPPSMGAAAGVLNGVSQIGAAFMPTVVGALVGVASATGHWISGLVFLVGIGLIGAVCALALVARGQ